MKVVYAVEYIESEFGQRSEGYRLYEDEQDCIKGTKDASARGPYEGGGGYYGPVRPLCYTEVPFTSLDKKYKKTLKNNPSCHTDNNWTPKFRGEKKYIK